MHDDKPRVHELILIVFRWHDLAHSEIVLINDFDRYVDCLPCLLEFAAHLVDAIYDAFAPLYI